MIDGKKRICSTNKNDLRTYNNNPKTTTGQGHDYATGCLLDYP